MLQWRNMVYFYELSIHESFYSSLFCIAKAALDASKQMQAAYASMVQSQTTMQSALSAWGHFEQESVRALNGKYNGQQDPALREGDSVPNMLNRMSLYHSEQVYCF